MGPRRWGHSHTGEEQSGWWGRGGSGLKGAQDSAGAQGGKRRRAGGAGVSRRFTLSRAPSTLSGGTSGPRSWSAARRRRRRWATTDSESALPVRIRPSKYLQESRTDAVRICGRINAWALGPRWPCNPILSGDLPFPVHCFEKKSPASLSCPKKTDLGVPIPGPQSARPPVTHQPGISIPTP